MSTQEDILLPRAQRKRMRLQQSAKPIDQANMTYVSQDDDPNNAVLQSVDDNAGQRIQGIKDMPVNPQTIDVQGKGLAQTYGQRQVPQATPLPTAAPTTQQAPTQPQQLATSKTGVVQVPKATPIPMQDNGKVTDMVKDKNLTYNDMLSMLTDQKAAEEKRIKREKQAARIATISQGLSSLANLYYTTKGAPNAFTPELSERMRTKYDQLTKERTANDRAFLQNYITMLERQRNDARIRQRNEITNNYYKTKGDLEAEKQRQEAALKQQAQEFAQKIAQEKLDETKRNNKERNEIARTRNVIAQINATNRGKSVRGGRNSAGKYWITDEYGKTWYYDNATMYGEKVNEIGQRLNVGDYDNVTRTSTSEVPDGLGGTQIKTSKTTSQQKKSNAAKAAEVTRKAAAVRNGSGSAMSNVSITGGRIDSQDNNTGKISIHKKK